MKIIGVLLIAAVALPGGILCEDYHPAADLPLVDDHGIKEDVLGKLSALKDVLHHLSTTPAQTTVAPATTSAPPTTTAAPSTTPAATSTAPPSTTPAASSSAPATSTPAPKTTTPAPTTTKTPPTSTPLPTTTRIPATTTVPSTNPVAPCYPLPPAFPNNTIACGATINGAQSAVDSIFFLPTAGVTNVTFFYNAFTIPDRFRIQDPSLAVCVNGPVFDSGFVGTAGQCPNFPPANNVTTTDGTGTYILQALGIPLYAIVVTSPCVSTVWSFTVTCT